MSAVLDLESLPEAMDRDGYAVLPGIVSRDRLQALADDLSREYAAADKFDGGGSIAGHLNCFPGSGAAFAYDELIEAGVVDAVHCMRTGRDNAIRVTMNWNLPGSVQQHFHIDGLYTEDFLICNVAVVDTTVHNGAIALLPGTSREFLPFWKYSVQRSYRGTKQIEMAQGDVLLRRSNLWHRGMPNHSDRPRPMLSITFGEKSAPEGDPFEGDIRFYENWYGTSRAGVLRERIFVAAPISYSAYRFAKSLRPGTGYDHY
jgi:ectoine hydroxylase-related dioxygenase (phytanoyl-CoA dioxygenase family)